MLSVNRSRMGTYWPERILSTSFHGNGSVAGDRLTPVGSSTLGTDAAPVTSWAPESGNSV